MPFFQTILEFLNTQWEAPQAYGVFHLICFALVFVTAFVLCFLWKKGIIRNTDRVVLITAIVVGVLEIYKQINYTFGDGSSDPYYQWYAFPWQFCSTPLYVGILAGLTKGKVQKCFNSYLATYALFAGLGVMFYPVTVFTPTVGICIQTMVCHGSMIAIGIFLFYTGSVKAHYTTLLQALPVFGANVSIAVLLNELAALIGITENHTFNMFFLSRHFASDLPVYSLIHNALITPGEPWSLKYVLCIVLYVFGFSVCAGLMVLAAYGLKRLFDYDFSARYAEADKIEAERKAREKEEKRLNEERIIAETDAKLEQIKKERAEKKEAARVAKAEKAARKEEAIRSRLDGEQLEKRNKKQAKQALKEEKRRLAKEEAAKKKAIKLEEKKRIAEEKAKAKEAEKLALLGKEIYEEKLAEKKALELEKQARKEKKQTPAEFIDEFIENITESSEDQKIALLGKEIYEEKLAEKEAHKLEVQLKKEDKIKYAELKVQQKAEAKEAEKRALLGEELYAKKLAEAQAEK